MIQTKRLNFTKFFYITLTTINFTKPKINLEVQGPMSNVLHDTPATKLH